MNHADSMQRAVTFAKKGLYTTMPNPRVGCVITKEGRILGEGFHEKAGQPHAEINALRQAGAKAHGATAYVTLEPCSHYGRTPPCADALIKAGITEVVIGSRDPNPQVSGAGIAALREAGISITTDVLKDECDALNPGFFKRMKTGFPTSGLPWVRVKLGMTLDAKIATASGESQWITSAASRADVQQLRAQSCVILSSSATVIADNPRLNVRLANTCRQPKRAIIDSQLRISSQSALFSSDEGQKGEILIYHNTKKIKECPFADKARLIRVPENQGYANLYAILKDLGNRQCNEVLVEAGGRLVGALLSANLVDEIIIYQAPMLLGEGAKPAFALAGIQKLDDARRFSLQDCCIIGADMKITLR
ncbi:MAG: bifunctional diaminohydroxyphosphoribosylaminopyrimidine deaminase/5-amino-6-(5-phosphoribosylamino)uracil reductase RibD [Ostreibacterium sp.]